MASTTDGSAAVSLYEDVMRSIDVALRQSATRMTTTVPLGEVPLREAEPVEPLPETARPLLRTIVMEAIAAPLPTPASPAPPPASSETRVVAADPANVEASRVDAEEKQPETVRRTSTSITMCSTLIARAMPVAEPVEAPPVSTPESTILLVTVEELEAEAAGPTTERLPRGTDNAENAASDNGTLISNQTVRPEPPSIEELAHAVVIAPHPASFIQRAASEPAFDPSSTPSFHSSPPMAVYGSTPPPPMAYPSTPPVAFAMASIAPPPVKRSGPWGALAALLVVGLVALAAAGVYVLRVRHVANPPSQAAAGIVAAPPPTTAAPTAAAPTMPPVVAPTADAKVESSAKAEEPNPSSTKTAKKPRKKAVVATKSPAPLPIATSEVEPAMTDDPSSLLGKGIDPANQL